MMFITFSKNLLLIKTFSKTIKEGKSLVKYNLSKMGMDSTITVTYNNYVIEKDNYKHKAAISGVMERKGDVFSPIKIDYSFSGGYGNIFIEIYIKELDKNFSYEAKYDEEEDEYIGSLLFPENAFDDIDKVEQFKNLNFTVRSRSNEKELLQKYMNDLNARTEELLQKYTNDLCARRDEYSG